MKTFLLCAGPTNVSREVKQALVCRNMCHRDEEFSEILLRTNKNLIKCLGIESSYSAVLFASSATGCNEAVISCIHGKILLIDSGKYSQRMGDIANRYNIPLRTIRLSNFAASPELIEDALIKDADITHIMFVHHETVSASLAPIEKICAIANRYNKLTVVDAVSSLFGHKLDIEKLNITFCTVNANKCLESFPGVSFVIGNTTEIKKLKGRSRSYYFDLYMHWEYERNGVTPFTTPVQLVSAVDKAIHRLIDEGICNRIERYKALAHRLRAGLRKIGFKLCILPENVQSNIVTTILIPSKFDYWMFYKALKCKGISIYPDLDAPEKKQFNLATLGSITIEDIDLIIERIENSLVELGYINLLK